MSSGKITIEDFKRAKQALMKASVPMSYVGFPCDPCCQTMAFDDCPQEAHPCKPQQAPARNKKMETTMTRYDTINVASVAAAPSDLAKAREYLVNRLMQVDDTKVRELREAFRINTPEGPKSAKEAVALIQAGKFTIPAKYEDADFQDMYGNSSWYRQFDWRTEPADRAGYDAAIKAKDEAKRATKDTIMVLPEDKGLEALNAFKAQTFH